MFPSLLFAALVITTRLLLFFVLPEVPPAIQSIITFVVAGAVGLIVHFGLSSKAKGVIGFGLTVVSVLASDQVSGFIPSRIAVPVAIVAAILTATSERLQGGLSDAAKRRNPDEHS